MMNRVLIKLLVTNLTVILLFLLGSVFIFPHAGESLFTLFWLGIFFSSILTLILGKIYLRPIGQITNVAEKILKGDFKTRLSLKRKDELGDLAGYLNRMSGQLQNKTAEILHDQSELKVILSSMVEGVLVINEDESIVVMNWPVFEMLDLRSKETIGKPYWEVIRHEEINSLLKEAISQKKSLKKEIMIISPQEAHFIMQVSCIFGSRGILHGVVAVFHDISELKKLAKLRCEFIANASHELKTPLTTIKGFVETLREGAIADRPQAEKFLSIISRHTQRLEDLIGDLLSLSAVESREMKLNMEKVKLFSVLESSFHLAMERWDANRHKVAFNIPPDISEVSIDRNLMEQAFLNLLDNALKFTPEGGEITISVGREKGFLRIDISDTGIGISKEHLSRIFERFYRVDKSRSRELGGTGLGLSIVKHIVQAHHGKISVQSEPGKGSTFSMFLPEILCS